MTVPTDSIVVTYNGYPLMLYAELATTLRLKDGDVLNLRTDVEKLLQANKSWNDSKWAIIKAMRSNKKNMQPIKTAPKDGTWVLLHRERYNSIIAQWDNGQWRTDNGKPVETKGNVIVGWEVF